MTENISSGSQNDENDDIYKDLGDFHFDKEFTKLEEKNKAYSEEISQLAERVKHLTEKNSELQHVNEILVTNISILLKTAKAEIARKQLVIDEFRKKIEDTNRRNRLNAENKYFQNDEGCKKCSSRQIKNSNVEIEDGEIEQDSFEEIEVKSEGRGKSINYRDKKDYSENKKKKRKNRERSRSRSKERYSSTQYHGSSRYPVESYSHRSGSSKKHHRHRSPEKRRHTERKRRSPENGKYSSASEYSRGSSSHRKDYSSHWKGEQQTNDEGTGCQKVRNMLDRKQTPVESGKKEKVGKKTSEPMDNGTLKSSSEADNKTKALTPDANVLFNRESDVGKVKAESQNRNSNVGKKISVEDYYERRNSGGNLHKENEKNVFERQSVLVSLYDGHSSPNRFSENHGKIGDNNVETASYSLPGGDPDWSSDESWTLSFGKKPEPVKKIKTLYSRRMEMKFQQQQLKEETEKITELQTQENKEENGPKRNEDNLVGASAEVQEEKEEGEITFEEEIFDGLMENAGNKEKEQQHLDDLTRKYPEGLQNPSSNNLDWISERSVDSKNVVETSFGESLIKKLIQLQKGGELPEIKEFSPLKHNYKLSKISPEKPVPKQHILEYYNLKPSSQQLNIIDSEMLDFSFPLPDTPGKSFLHSFTYTREELRVDTATENLIQDEKGLAKPKNSLKDENDENKTCGKEKNDMYKMGTCPDGYETKTEDSKVAAVNSLNGKKTTEVQKKIIEHKTDKNKPTSEGSEISYQIKTRSKTVSENKKNIQSKGSNTKKASSKVNMSKRKRKSTSSDGEEADKEIKKKKIIRKAVDCEKEKNNKEKDIDDAIISDSGKCVISSVESCRSTRGNSAEDLPLCNINYNHSPDSPNDRVLKENESPVTSDNTTRDSSSFKVLRSYLLLSTNEEGVVDLLSDGSSCCSGDYSDSGASAFVDMLEI